MRRLSISKLMVVVAFIAVNCWAVRLLSGWIVADYGTRIVLAALLPLFNAAVVLTYLTARRYRIALRRRPPGKRAFLPTFALNCFVMATLSVMAVFEAKTPYFGVLAFLARPIESVVHAIGVEIGPDSHLNRFIFWCVVFGPVASGLPLLLAGVWAFASSRYAMMVEPR